MPRCVCEGRPLMKKVQQTATSTVYECPQCGRIVTFAPRTVSRG